MGTNLRERQLAIGTHGHHHPPTALPRYTVEVPVELEKLRRLCYRPFGHQPSDQISPQRDHQLAREGDDRDAPHATLVVANIVSKPAAERAFRLMVQPKPGQFDGDRPGTSVAGSADPLIGAAAATVVRAGRPSRS